MAIRKRYLLLLFLLFSCAGEQITPEVFIKGVPFVKQSPGNAGPAAAEMVLRFYGYDMDQERIKMCDPLRRGVNYRRMAAFLNRNGIKTEVVYGSIPEIREFLDRGMPVIVRQWSSYRKRTRHYRVVVGIDEPRQVVVCLDPRTGRKSIPYRFFEILWDVDYRKEPTTNLMIIIYPKDVRKKRGPTSSSRAFVR